LERGCRAMPETLSARPTHVLLQHVVVVLLPIAAVGALLVALSARYRHHLGVVSLVATFWITLAVPLTTQSGESLEGRLPDSPSVAAHAAAGDRVLWVAACCGVCLLAVVALDVRCRVSMRGDLAPAEVWVGRHAPSSWNEGAPGWAPGALMIGGVWT